MGLIDVGLDLGRTGSGLIVDGSALVGLSGEEGSWVGSRSFLFRGVQLAEDNSKPLRDFTLFFRVLYFTTSSR